MAGSLAVAGCGWLAPLQLWHSRAVAVVPPLVVGWNAAAAAAAAVSYERSVYTRVSPSCTLHMQLDVAK